MYNEILEVGLGIASDEWIDLRWIHFFTVTTLLNGFPHQVNRPTPSRDSLGMPASQQPQLRQGLCLALEPGELRDVSPSIRLTTLRLYELSTFFYVIADVRIPVHAIEQ